MFSAGSLSVQLIVLNFGRTPVLMLSRRRSHALFVPQGNCGFDAQGASGGRQR